MAAVTGASNWLFRGRPSLETIVVPGAVLLGSLAVYATLRALLLLASARSPTACLIADAAALGIAALFYEVRYSDVPGLLRPLLRGIGAVVLAQVVFDDTALSYASTSVVAGPPRVFFVAGGIAAVAAGVAGLIRPSFLIPLFAHYVAFRHQLNSATGVEISQTDYLSMLDIGEFVTIGALGVVLARRLSPGQALRRDDTGKFRQVEIAAAALIWACAVGAHFGNYLVSGWTKIRAGGDDPFFWLLHNPTQTSILIGLERGDNPLAAWPALVQLSWDAISFGGIALNLFVLGTQITAPLALLHRRSIMLYTLLFDLFHVAVYLTLGAAFLFWVAVNMFIYASARRMPDEAFSPGVRLVAVGSVVLGHFIFYTSHLGWLDGAKLASPSVVAETADGRVVPVPSVYFGILSYSIAQTAMYIPDGHFPMRLGGNTYNRTDWHDTQTCGSDIRQRQDTGVSLATIERMVTETDAAMRQNPAVKELNLYYLYPHHMVANPFMFEAFNRLTMNDIVGYRYIVDSVCLSLEEGRLRRDVRKRWEHAVDVGRH